MQTAVTKKKKQGKKLNKKRSSASANNKTALKTHCLTIVHPVPYLFPTLKQWFLKKHVVKGPFKRQKSKV